MERLILQDNTREKQRRLKHPRVALLLVNVMRGMLPKGAAGQYLSTTIHPEAHTLAGWN